LIPTFSPQGDGNVGFNEGIGVDHRC